MIRDKGIMGLALCAWCFGYSNSIASPSSLKADQAQAAHDLLLANTLITNDPHMRACGPLPTDRRLLNALKYADGSTLVSTPGLTRGLRALPADMLRASWCIPPRPKNNDISNLTAWFHHFFQVHRYSGQELLTYDILTAPNSVGGKSLSAKSVGGGSMSVNQAAKASSGKITLSAAEYLIPLFSLPPAQKEKGGKCAGYSLDEGSIWTSIGSGGLDNSGSLLQAGILFKLSCGKAGFPPLVSLSFFGEFLPAEQGAVIPPFPVQIQSTDDVYTGVYWSADANGNPSMAMYTFIDDTKQLGRQYADPNPGSSLETLAAMAVGEPPFINNTTVADYPALVKNMFQFKSTTMAVDATGTLSYPIGSGFTTVKNKVTTKFSGVRLYTDYPPDSGNPAFTNVVGHYDVNTAITSFNLVATE